MTMTAALEQGTEMVKEAVMIMSKNLPGPSR
jgi:hypothetical protein